MKTLVIILSQTRAHELTFNNFKTNVIDELNADLCICIGKKENYDYENPYYRLAKYRFIYDESQDTSFFNALNFAYNNTKNEKYEKIINMVSDINYNLELQNDNMRYIGNFDDFLNINYKDYDDDEIIYFSNDYNNKELCNKCYAIKNSNKKLIFCENTVLLKKKLHYNDFLDIKTNIATENSDPNNFNGFSISTFIHIFFLWFLQFNITKSNIMYIYDRFIITRSDYIYTVTHPKLEYLNENYIWIPDGEHHDGICDRHVILSKKNMIEYISILDNFISKSNEYYNYFLNKTNLNMEKILKYHLDKNSLTKDIRYIPYIFYTVRGENDNSRWVLGKYNPKLGYYIKYSNEYKLANFNQKNFIHKKKYLYYPLQINLINSLKKLHI